MKKTIIKDEFAIHLEGEYFENRHKWQERGIRKEWTIIPSARIENKEEGIIAEVWADNIKINTEGILGHIHPEFTFDLVTTLESPEIEKLHVPEILKDFIHHCWYNGDVCD